MSTDRGPLLASAGVHDRVGGLWKGVPGRGVPGHVVHTLDPSVVPPSMEKLLVEDTAVAVAAAGVPLRVAATEAAGAVAVVLGGAAAMLGAEVAVAVGAVLLAGVLHSLSALPTDTWLAAGRVATLLPSSLPATLGGSSGGHALVPATVLPDTKPADWAGLAGAAMGVSPRTTAIAAAAAAMTGGGGPAVGAALVAGAAGVAEAALAAVLATEAPPPAWAAPPGTCRSLADACGPRWPSLARLRRAVPPAVPPAPLGEDGDAAPPAPRGLAPAGGDDPVLRLVGLSAEPWLATPPSDFRPGGDAALVL